MVLAGYHPGWTGMGGTAEDRRHGDGVLGRDMMGMAQQEAGECCRQQTRGPLIALKSCLEFVLIFEGLHIFLYKKRI